MAGAAKRDKVIKLISLFKIAVKFLKWPDVMNIEVSIAACFVAACLAGMLISLFDHALLVSPVGAIGNFRKRATCPMGVILATTCGRQLGIDAFRRTASRAAQPFLDFLCAVFFAANGTGKCEPAVWFSGRKFRLVGSKLRTALTRTEPIGAVGPTLKRYAAPIAGKDTALVRIYQALLSAFDRAKSTRGLVANYNKVFTTVFTRQGDAAAHRKTTAFNRAILTPFQIMATVHRVYLAALRTLFFHERYYTLDCVG